MAKKINLTSLENTKLLIIQKFFKKILRFLYLKNNLIKKCLTLNNNLSNIMIHTQYCLDINIISSEYFSSIMTNMEIFLKEYSEVYKILVNDKINLIRNKFFIYYKKVQDLENKLYTIYSYIGASSLKKLLNCHINFDEIYESFSLEYKSHFDLYNQIFIPISLDYYYIDKNLDYQFLQVNNNNNKSNHISILQSFLTYKSDDEFLNDKQYLLKNKVIIPQFINIPNTSEDIYISKICIPSKNLSSYICKGFFIKDSINIFRKHPLLQKKIDSLHKSQNSESIEINFYNTFIFQMSLRDIVLKDTNEIKDKIYDSYNELKKLKQKTISNLVKDFLMLNNIKKSETLTILLLNKNDTDSQYLAYLLFDMISQESSNNNQSSKVFQNLHWSIQKIFKISLEEISKKNNKLLNITEDEIPYEKRIYLMKADDYVKHKALEKYKEISSKSNDSSNKAQQYLDGILKIPFGVYKKEKIIEFLTIYSSKISRFVDSIKELKINDQDKELINLISEIKKLTENKILSTQLINKLLNDSRFNYFNGNFRFDADKFKILFQKSNYSNLKKIIKNIKKNNNCKNIIINNNEYIKLTSQNETVDTNIIINQLITYVDEKYNSILKNPCKDNINNFINIIECFEINKLYYHSENNTYLSTIFNKYQILNEEWTTYQTDKNSYLQDIRKYLNSAVYGHEDAKNQIERIIAQWISGENSGYCLGFEGPPGTGKTSIAKKGLTKCLLDEDGTPRPFSFIAVGGSSNGSTLEGHSYTYVGSTWGKIVDILMETKCMNPIIFIDELDKISRTEHGKELIGILTHLTDASQNNEFCDKYFSGVKIDLSKILFIFSYNNPELIDPILLDRIHRIRFNPLKKPEKIYIAKNYLLSEISKAVGFNKGEINISEDILSKIIDEYTFEAGVRKLKERLFEIIREINLRSLLKTNIYNEQIKYPFDLKQEHITQDIFIKRAKISPKNILNEPKIGMVNGLYATQNGMGGITLIETYKILSSSVLELELTGQQGDVMKESMKVAKTVTWNILPEDKKINIKNEMKNFGNYSLHVHCPEGATPKDGPSAGLAITTSLISVLTGIPVNNKVAMTGEINLNGKALQIGGLESKLYGAKRAGVTRVLIPKENEKDLDVIKMEKYNSELFIDFEIILVDNIWDVLSYALINKINFANHTIPNEQKVFNVYTSKTFLDSSRSVNFDKPIKSYLWEQKTGPTISTIVSPVESKTEITNLDEGTYSFKLTLDYDNEITSSDEIILKVKNTPYTIIKNDKNIIYENNYELDGSKSEFNLDRIREIKWDVIKQTNNKTVIFENNNNIKTRITNLENGTYCFKLSIYYTDDKMSSDFCQLIVKSEPCAIVDLIKHI